MSQPKVFVFVHGEDGKAVGAGELRYTARRCELAGTFAGYFNAEERDKNPNEMVAVVGGASIRDYVVPVTQISDFPDHPGYQK